MIERLTQREKEALGYAAQGFSNEKIAQKMSIALCTVKTHLNCVYEKFELTGLSLGGAIRVNAVLIYQKEKENLKQT